MIVKLTSDQIAATGAKDPADFSAKFSALIEDNKQLKAMAEKPSDFSAFEKRLADVEAGNATLQGQVKTFTTEAQVKTIAAETTTATLSSEPGKKLIEAEASRVVMAAMASTGTSPVKPSPAPAGTPSAKDLVASGKFEEAYAASPELQAEFSSAALYATYAKAVKAGKILAR